MDKREKMLKRALGRLKKDEERKLDEINGKIRANNFKLSMLLSGKLLYLQDCLRKRGVIFSSEHIKSKKLNIRRDQGFIQAFDPGDNEYYLCSKNKFSQERECCGWVSGKPIKEEYKYRNAGKIIKGIKYKCFVCDRIVGEKVL